MSADPLLRVDRLSVALGPGDGAPAVIADVSFSIARGETLCLVGESGCGKSVTALAIMGLLPKIMRVSSGRVLLEGRDLLKLPPTEMRGLRGDRVAMVFQEPMTSLNPVLTIGTQIAETLRAHRAIDARSAKAEARRLLDLVRVPDATRRLAEYPHLLSGGMRQRVMIAIALALNPVLLIADEPTTALDVTIQAQILTLMDDLKRETGAALLLITHDLGVVAEMADRIMVLYAGRVIEAGDAQDVFDRPTHPYTIGLIKAVPRLDVEAGEILREIPGSVPSLLELGRGCSFAGRCPIVEARCESAVPEFARLSPSHIAACRRIDVAPEAWSLA